MTYKYLNMRDGQTVERDQRCRRRDRMQHWVLLEAPATDREAAKRVARRFGDEFVSLIGDISDRPKGNASRETWAAYAETVGVEVADDDTRDDIREACG